MVREGSEAYDISTGARMNGLDGLLCFDCKFQRREQRAWRLEFIKH